MPISISRQGLGIWTSHNGQLAEDKVRSPIAIESATP